jgi:hypothetical protein
MQEVSPMAEATAEEGMCSKGKVKVVPESTWHAALMRRAVGVYRTLQARKKAELVAFKKANKKLLAKLDYLAKKSTVLGYNYAVAVGEAQYKRELALAELDFKAASKLVGVSHQAALAAAEFADLKNLLYVEASVAGVVSGDYERRDKTEVEKPEVEKRKVKKAKFVRPKLKGFEFDPGNQVFDPRKQPNLVNFLGKSKHTEYQDLLTEFENLRLGVELADMPEALAALRTFRDAAAPEA